MLVYLQPAHVGASFAQNGHENCCAVLFHCVGVEGEVAANRITDLHVGCTVTCCCTL